MRDVKHWILHSIPVEFNTAIDKLESEKQLYFNEKHELELSCDILFCRDVRGHKKFCKTVHRHRPPTNQRTLTLTSGGNFTL